MNDTKKRLIGYGLGSSVLAGLLFCGFAYAPDADSMTLLGSVEVHLKLAASIPVTDRNGQPDTVRAKLLQDGRAFLARARKQDPELFLGFEYEAWLAGLDGDFRRAAAMYRRAQDGERATRETREADLLNEARMWRASQEPKRAIDALDRWQGKFSAKNSDASVIERMLALEDVGDRDSAMAVATRLAAVAKKSMALMEAGHYLQRAGDPSAAEQAYAKAASRNPIANYYLAGLKVRAQEFDIALELLECSIAVNGHLVRDMLKRDSEIWKPVHGNERFRKLYLPANEAATQGR